MNAVARYLRNNPCLRQRVKQGVSPLFEAVSELLPLEEGTPRQDSTARVWRSWRGTTEGCHKQMTKATIRTE